MPSDKKKELGEDDYKINNGPSKFDLMMALFSPVSLTVDFGLERRAGERRGRRAIPVHITGLVREDGSGESWLIGGWVDGLCMRNFRAWFRTDRRTGLLSIEPC